MKLVIIIRGIFMGRQEKMIKEMKKDGKGIGETRVEKVGGEGKVSEEEGEEEAE